MLYVKKSRHIANNAGLGNVGFPTKGDNELSAGRHLLTPPACHLGGDACWGAGPFHSLAPSPERDVEPRVVRLGSTDGRLSPVVVRVGSHLKGG